MSHELAMLLNGRAAFTRVQGSEKAWWEGWNGLEANLIDPKAPIEEWLRSSGADFEVETVPLFTQTFAEKPDWALPHHLLPPTYEESPIGVMLRRADNHYPLAHVKNQYTPIQNHRMFQIFRDYLDHDMVEIETCGVLREGEVVFMLARVIDADQFLPGGDQLKEYILLTSKHGGGSNGVHTVSVRVVCNNTLVMALKSGSSIMSVRHTSELTDERIEQLKMNAGISVKQIKQRQEMNRVLAESKVDESWAQNYFKEILGKPALSLDDQPRAVYHAMDLFKGEGIGSDLESAKGTAWGAVNAVTEWVDHERGSDAKRLFQSLLDQGAKLKEKAYVTAYEKVTA